MMAAIADAAITKKVPMPTTVLMSSRVTRIGWAPTITETSSWYHAALRQPSQDVRAPPRDPHAPALAPHCHDRFQPAHARRTPRARETRQSLGRGRARAQHVRAAPPRAGHAAIATRRSAPSESCGASRLLQAGSVEHAFRRRLEL